MIEIVKPIESLTVADLETDPVWQYANRDGPGEILVRPVQRVPVKSLAGKIVGTQIRLANGAQAWAIIGNIDAGNPRLTEHFVSVSVERDGMWFALARYHDHDFAERGPGALARFLHLNVEDVFPFSFDVRQYAHGDPLALAGSVQKEPREKLSRADLIALAVP